jgi:hypothetical protein
VLLDDVEREVVGAESDLEERDADGQQPAESEDRAARDVDPAAVSARSAERGDDGEDGGDEGERQRGAAEASLHSPS